MRQPSPTLWILLAALAALNVVSPSAGAQASKRAASADVVELLRPVPGVEGPRVVEVSTEPQIRIRVRAAVASVTLGSAGEAVVLRGGGANGAGSRLPGPVTVLPRADGFVTADATGSRLKWTIDRLHAAAAIPGQPFSLDGGLHPGTLGLVRTGTDQAPLLDAVETVSLEAYLPGVLDRELYASWSPEAFSAQAIAARSYALWEREVARLAEAAGEGDGFDLEATVASQAYGGVARNPKAHAAVAATRGVVLAWEGRVLPAFYSSAVGGPGADAAQTFPGRAPDVPPLRGVDHGARDGASPRFSWGPVLRDRLTLSRRIAAWGRLNQDPVADLRNLVRIEPAAANRAGRLAAYRLHDANGGQFLLRADELRHAANTPARGLEPITGDDRLYSGDFRVRRQGADFQFYGGRGFGHGVGLSQWGAQGMAAEGHRHPAILSAYYPGASLVRAYP